MSEPAPSLVPPSERLRAYLLKFVVAAAMLHGMLLSWKLWLPDRTYPLTPVADWLPTVPAWLGQFWLGALLGLLVAIAILPWPRIWIGAFVLLAGALALWDQTRWQPWFYQYLVMFVCLWAFPWGKRDLGQRSPAALNACRLIIAFTYIWSGLQKFNCDFAVEVFPWLIQPLLAKLPPEAAKLTPHLALLPPIIETSMGLALLVPAYRGLGILLAIGMHATILACLGPEGHNWNTVVWPWNRAMVVFVLLLFWHRPKVPLAHVLWPGRSVVQWAALVLFGVMPAFNFVGCWDSYLSAALYSGNTVSADIVLSRTAYDRLPPEVQAHFSDTGDSRYFLSKLDMMSWSIDEMNVPPYPAERVFRGIGRKLLTGIDHPTECQLVIHGRPNWLTRERQVTRYMGWGLDEPVEVER
jgi:hypothetical protein